MALDPSLTSFLVSNVGINNTQNIDRVSLAGGVLGTLSTPGFPNGIIYDNTGRLFVNVQVSATDHRVRQINPATGAVMASSANLGFFLDGLTFDATTGLLFGSARDQSTFGAPARIVQIDPSNLSNVTLISPTGTPLQGPDGIVSDGLGHLYIADFGNVLQYDIATHNEIVVATSQFGFDDIAPAAGLGAPTDAAAVPEPSSLAILGASLAGLGLARRRRRVRKAEQLG